MPRFYQYQSNLNAPKLIAVAIALSVTSYSADNFVQPKRNLGNIGEFNSNAPQTIASTTVIASQFIDSTNPPKKNTGSNTGEFNSNTSQSSIAAPTIISTTTLSNWLETQKRWPANTGDFTSNTPQVTAAPVISSLFEDKLIDTPALKRKFQTDSGYVLNAPPVFLIPTQFEDKLIDTPALKRKWQTDTGYVLNAPQIIATLIATNTEAFTIPKKNAGSNTGDFNANTPQTIVQPVIASQFEDKLIDAPALRKKWPADSGYVLNAPPIVAPPVIAAQFVDALQIRRLWQTDTGYILNAPEETAAPIISAQFEDKITDAPAIKKLKQSDAGYVLNAPPVLPPPVIASQFIDAPPLRRLWQADLGYVANAPPVIILAALFEDRFIDSPALRKKWTTDAGYVLNAPQIQPPPVIASQFIDTVPLRKRWQNETLFLYGASPYFIPLAPGVITLVQAFTMALQVSATDATGGTPPYSYQYAIRFAGVGPYVNVALTTLAGVITGLTPSTAYDIQLAYTDQEPATVFAYLLGVMTSGGGGATALLEQDWALTFGVGYQ